MDPLDARFRDSYETLHRLKEELLGARLHAREDESTWGGWSVRFNQRLRLERQRLAILLEPPPAADPRLLATYEAGTALRTLYEEMNRAIEGKLTDVAAKRIELERALHRLRDALEAGA